MKKIYLDMQPTWRKKTGIGWYTYNLVEKLCGCTDNKYLFLGGLFNPFGIQKKIKKIEKLKYREIKYFWPFYSYAGFFSKKFFRWRFFNFNNLTNTKCDIYHFFNFLIPHKIDGKVVVTIHDLIYKKMPEVVGFDIEYFDKEVEYSLKKSDVIITVSNAAKRDILNSFNEIDEKKIRVVEPGVKIEEYNFGYNDEEKKKLKVKYNIDLESEIILYVGTVEIRKNILNIIKAFNLYKQKNKEKKIELLIIGGQGLGYDRILKEYEESNYKDYIKFIGYINDNEKKKFYKSATVFLFPSFYEGFGMPIIEAMAAGVPVITSNISSLPEAAGNAGILVDPNSFLDLEKNIAKVLADKNLRQEMIKRGHKHVQNFTWEISAKKIRQIYDEL